MKVIFFLAMFFAASASANIANEINELKARVYESVQHKDYSKSFELSKRLMDIDPSSIEFFRLFVLTYNFLEMKENLSCNELRDYAGQVAESSSEMRKDKMLYIANIENKFYLLSGKKCEINKDIKQPPPKNGG